MEKYNKNEHSETHYQKNCKLKQIIFTIINSI